jgi:hypothetical protein
MKNPGIEERFLKDVANHEMSVVRDDGVHRHLRFASPKCGSYWFDIITYTGSLVIDGDCGTYVFRRTRDMFEFFRTDREYMERKGAKLAINPGYWAEKVQAHPGKGLKEFDEEKFDRAVMEYLRNWIRGHRDRTDKDERRDLWEAVVNEVINADGADRKQMAAYDFHHTIRDDNRLSKRLGWDCKRQPDPLAFVFQDFWEVNVERWTHGFIWNCYAIAWAVKVYDEAKQPAAEAVAESTAA